MSTIPFFWTRFWDKSLHYTGHASKYDEVFIDGNLKEQNFIAYYLKDERVVAAAAMNRIPHITIIN